MSGKTVLKGWRFGAFVGALVGAVALFTYPIVVAPFLDPEPYRRASERNRAGLDQEEIQPGNMKVWSDPFDRKGKPGSK